MIRNLARLERRHPELVPRTDKPPSQTATEGEVKAGANEQPQPKAEGEVQKSAPSAAVGSKTKKERFPQYLLKPPYVYTVQVESFKDENVAAARMQELQDRGFDAWVAWIDLGEMGIWYRVLVGKYKDKSEAETMARELSRSKEFYRARQIATHKEVVTGQGGNKD